MAMSKRYAFLFLCLGLAKGAVGQERTRRPAAFKSAFANSIHSPMWVSPTQIYQIAGNRMDWLLHSQTETIDRVTSDQMRGDESQLRTTRIKGGFLSRYPASAAGRIGVLVDYADLRRIDVEWQQTPRGRLSFAPSHADDLADQINRRLSIEPVFAYTVWEWLTIGGSYELQRWQSTNAALEQTTDAQTIKSGLGVFSEFFELGAFAEWSATIGRRQQQLSTDAAGELAAREDGSELYDLYGALARIAIVQDWNIGLSRILTVPPSQRVSAFDPVITTDRYVLEFVGELGSLEGFYERSENFRSKHPVDEIITGESKRWGASLLLKTAANARYGVAFATMEGTGYRASSEADAPTSVIRRGQELSLLGFVPL
jgi:hypothetical protein